MANVRVNMGEGRGLAIIFEDLDVDQLNVIRWVLDQRFHGSERTTAIANDLSERLEQAVRVALARQEESL